MAGGKAMAERERLIAKHGGYRRLRSFQVAQLVYDVTVRFCDRYVDRHSRTRDQMVQAARSGVQNIAEGSAASGTSKKTELKLTGVARASLEELRLDYQDFLRQRGQTQWERDDPRRADLIARRCRTADAVAAWAKEIHDGHGGRGGRNGQCGQAGGRGASVESAASTPSTRSTPSMSSMPSATYAEISANGALTLITVACSLLDRQLAAQAAAFEEEGGFTERLYRVRSRRRGQ
jgi:four helix bundle suffix protein